MLLNIRDVLGEKEKADQIYLQMASKGKGTEYTVYRGVRLLVINRQYQEAERILKPFLKIGSPRLWRLMATILLKQQKPDEAANLYSQFIQNNPNTLWGRMFLGDLFYFFLGKPSEGVKLWEEVLGMEEEVSKSTIDPARYAYKRLTKYYLEKGDKEKALQLYEGFYKLTPSNFYETDFLNLVKLLIEFGREEEAKNVALTGLKVSPKYHQLRALYTTLWGIPPIRKEHKWEEYTKLKYPDVEKLPIKTKLITEADEIEEIVLQATSGRLKQGDIVAIASSVVSISEGMFYMADGIKAGPIAWLLASFVERKSLFQTLKEHHGEPFQLLAPLANPLAMQALIEEVGTYTVLKAAIYGAWGRLTGKRGQFYAHATPQAALIDDMPASMAPYDYYIIMGPSDSDKVAKRIADKIGADVVIVDANDLTGAWVVGASSEQIDRKLVEDVLMDNPSGNQDQQRPIIIIRNLHT